MENYGAFVELTPNLAGLAETKEGVRAGQQASVYIKYHSRKNENQTDNY